MITEDMKNLNVNYKYKVESLNILFKDGTDVAIDTGVINHLYIEKDLDNDFFPIMNLSLLMTDDLYDKINKENETIKFRLKVKSNIYDNQNKYIRYESFCNDLFVAFLNKTIVVKDEESVQTKHTAQKTDIEIPSNPRNFYLFKEEVIKCKTVLNISVESASLTDLALYMYNKCGIQKLLMSKLDNKDSVSDLLIPSGNLIECLNYVDNLKGFYNKGAIIFFDIDTAYLIDNSSRCTAWRKNEVRMTHIHISNQKNVDSQLTGIYTNADRKSNHVFANTERIEISNPNLVNDQLKGNNVVLVDGKTNKVDNISDKNVTQIGSANIRVLVSNERNPYTISALKYRMKENECIMNVAFLGVDINAFSPNKEFMVTYEDSKLNKQYGGHYRISKIVSKLKKDGEELVGEVDCTFLKQD